MGSDGAGREEQDRFIVDKPGFVRIMVDLQEQLRRPFVAKPFDLKVASVTF